MSRFHFIFCLLLSSLMVVAKPDPGFIRSEARDMIAVCNSFTFLDLYQNDAEIIPAGYEKRYTSGTFGMDNKYQVYVKDDMAVISFRGSTDKQLSWIENMYASMIPATGTILLEGEKFTYCFARDSGAAVHSGYALGIAFLHNELIYQIKNLNREGIYNFIITGHSQGGAMANMCKAWLENLPGGIIAQKNFFKVYAFAAPMVGNRPFSNEYNQRFASAGMSFNIVGANDVIQSFPVNYNDSNFIRHNMNAIMFGNDFSLKKMLLEGSARMFNGEISRLMGFVGRSANKKISKDVSDVVMPQSVKDINYFALDNRIVLPEFEFPKILKDSLILQNDSLMQVTQRDEDGSFHDKSLYKSGSWAWQHKPYNYFVAILKEWFPQDYLKLEKKFLPENL